MTEPKDGLHYGSLSANSDGAPRSGKIVLANWIHAAFAPLGSSYRLAIPHRPLGVAAASFSCLLLTSVSSTPEAFHANAATPTIEHETRSHNEVWRSQARERAP